MKPSDGSLDIPFLQLEPWRYCETCPGKRLKARANHLVMHGGSRRLTTLINNPHPPSPQAEHLHSAARCHMIPCSEPLMLSGQAPLSMRRKWYAVNMHFQRLTVFPCGTDLFYLLLIVIINIHKKAARVILMVMFLKLHSHIFDAFANSRTLHNGVFVFTACTCQFLHILCLSCKNGHKFIQTQSYGIEIYTAPSGESHI